MSSRVFSALLVFLSLFVGCTADDAGALASGGTVGSGGTTFGMLSSGGTTVTGGSLASGGTPLSGGVLSDGGQITTGGLATGGSGTGGMGTGGSGTGGMGTGGSGTGGMGTGGDQAPAFNPCPVNGDVCEILPFGDSITWGTGSTDEAGYRSKLFALALANNKKITFTGSLSIGPDQVSGVAFPKDNEGRFGWTIDPGFSSWADGVSTLVPSPAFDAIPHIVLLMIGTNDVNSDHGQSTMTDRLESLLDKIILAAPNALIVLAEITPLGGNPAALVAYNAAIPGIVTARAAMGQHIMLVDMSAMPLTGLSGDNVHPNDGGYDFMAQTWYDAIAEYLPN